MDKRTKNNMYDCQSWVHIFNGSFGSVVDKRMRVQLLEDRGRVVGGELSRGLVVRIPKIVLSVGINYRITGSIKLLHDQFTI